MMGARGGTGLLLVALLLLATGCERGGEEPSPEALEQRALAARSACLSAELVRTAEDELQTLEQTIPRSGEDPATELLRRTGQAAVAYARAYLQHAQLRAAALARIDSALNYAPSSTDSLRHLEAAARFELRAPEPGTVEANVREAYARELAAQLADADHPCNWNFEQ